jgi:hypothetical protein
VLIGIFPEEVRPAERNIARTTQFRRQLGTSAAMPKIGGSQQTNNLLISMTALERPFRKSLRLHSVSSSRSMEKVRHSQVAEPKRHKACAEISELVALKLTLASVARLRSAMRR